MNFKMRDLSLTRKARKNFIVGLHDLAPLKQGEYNALEVRHAIGKPDYIRNIDRAEALENEIFFNGITRKQAKDAVKNIGIYRERVAISENIFILATVFASVFLILSILGVLIEPIRNFIAGIINSNNAIAYVGLAVPLTSAAALMALKGSIKTKLDLSLIEKFKVFFDNENSLEENAKNPAVQRRLSAHQKTKLRKVVGAENLNISNLGALSKEALLILTEDINQLLLSKQEGEDFEYQFDTIGIEDTYEEDENSGGELIEEPLVLERKPKKQFRLFGSRA